MQAAAGASLTPEGDVAAHRRTPTLPARRLWLFALVAVVAWSADVASKAVAVHLLAGQGSVDVIPGVLDLTLARNPGAAFSVGTSLTQVLTVVAGAVVVVIAWLSMRIRDRVWAVALGLLLGGALGNLTDRMLREPGPFRGHVVDFLRLPHWPVFNLADSCIVVAALLIAVQALRGAALNGTRTTSADRT